MDIYLPIAGLAVNWILIVALGSLVGLLSGLFGVGGGFLTTPLLIFYGIPPTVAVASSTTQIAGASVSGYFAHHRRGGVDRKMGLVMIAVGAMGLASTLGLALLERRREIGVLRAIGAGDGAILAMVQVEGLTLVALAWLASLPLALPISALLEAAFGRIMFAVPWRLVPSAGTALAWLGLMALISLLACALPARRALRIPAAQALAYS